MRKSFGKNKAPENRESTLQDGTDLLGCIILMKQVLPDSVLKNVIKLAYLIRKCYFTFLGIYGNIMPAQIIDDFASFISDLEFGVITMSPPSFFVKTARSGRFFIFFCKMVFISSIYETDNIIKTIDFTLNRDMV